MQEVAGLKGQSGTGVIDSLAETTVTFKTAPVKFDSESNWSAERARSESQALNPNAAGHGVDLYWD